MGSKNIGKRISRIEEELEKMSEGQDRVFNSENTDYEQYERGRLRGMSRKELGVIAGEVDEIIKKGSNTFLIDCYWKLRINGVPKNKMDYDSYNVFR